MNNDSLLIKASEVSVNSKSMSSFDERIDFTFYVDAGLYQPIKFFEQWIDYITGAATEGENQLNNPQYHYRMKYPNDYIAGQGLKITKFEKDHLNPVSYTHLTLPTSDLV